MDRIFIIFRKIRKHPIKLIFLFVVVFSIFPPYKYHSRQIGEFHFAKYVDEYKRLRSIDDRSEQHRKEKELEGKIRQDILKKYPLGSEVKTLLNSLLVSGMKDIKNKDGSAHKECVKVSKRETEIGYKCNLYLEKYILITPSYQYFLIGNFYKYTFTSLHLSIDIVFDSDGLVYNLSTMLRKKIP